MQYLKINEDGTRKLYPRKPQWFNDSGELVSDQYLLENENIYPVKEPEIPVSEAYIGYPKTKPIEEWTINDTTATKNVWIYVNDRPSYDGFYQSIEKNSEDKWIEESVDGKDYDRIKMTFTLKEKTLDEKKVDMKEELADRRWNVETGGMDFTSNSTGKNYKIHTDRESQSKLIAVYLLATQGKITEKSWKTKEGFKILSAQEIIEMAETLENFVQECYNNEERISNLIDSCSSIDDLRDLITIETDNDGNIIKENEFDKQWPSIALW